MSLLAVSNRSLLYTSAYRKYVALAFGLLDVGAILTSASNHPLVVERDGPRSKERGFSLKLHEKTPSAPLSPFYLNLRTPGNPKPGPLTHSLINLAAYCMYGAARAELLVYDRVVGVPRAGDPFAEEFCRFSDATCHKMEKDETAGGRRVTRLEERRRPERGTRFLLVDDMITRADSKIEAVQVLRRDGYEVRDCIVLVDREQGGREELRKHEVRLHMVFTINELLGLYVGAGRLSPELYTEITEYLAHAA